MKKGLTLLEIILAMGLTTGLMVGVSSIMQNVTKQNKDIDVRVGINEDKAEVLVQLKRRLANSAIMMDNSLFENKSTELNTISAYTMKVGTVPIKNDSAGTYINDNRRHLVLDKSGDNFTFYYYSAAALGTFTDNDLEIKLLDVSRYNVGDILFLSSTKKNRGGLFSVREVDGDKNLLRVVAKSSIPSNFSFALSSSDNLSFADIKNMAFKESNSVFWIFKIHFVRYAVEDVNDHDKRLLIEHWDAFIHGQDDVRQTTVDFFKKLEIRHKFYPLSLEGNKLTDLVGSIQVDMVFAQLNADRKGVKSGRASVVVTVKDMFDSFLQEGIAIEKKLRAAETHGQKLPAIYLEVKQVEGIRCAASLKCKDASTAIPDDIFFDQVYIGHKELANHASTAPSPIIKKLKSIANLGSFTGPDDPTERLFIDDLKNRAISFRNKACSSTPLSKNDFICGPDPLLPDYYIQLKMIVVGQGGMNELEQSSRGTFEIKEVNSAGGKLPKILHECWPTAKFISSQGIYALLNDGSNNTSFGKPVDKSVSGSPDKIYEYTSYCRIYRKYEDGKDDLNYYFGTKPTELSFRIRDLDIPYKGISEDKTSYKSTFPFVLKLYTYKDKNKDNPADPFAAAKNNPFRFIKDNNPLSAKCIKKNCKSLYKCSSPTTCVALSENNMRAFQFKGVLSNSPKEYIPPINEFPAVIRATLGALCNEPTRGSGSIRSCNNSDRKNMQRVCFFFPAILYKEYYGRSAYQCD